MTVQDIKTLRKALGLTQRELAEKLGVSRLTVARWESEIKKPSAKNREQLLQLAKEQDTKKDTNVSRQDTKRDTKSENVSQQDTNVSRENTNVSREQDTFSEQDTKRDTKSENVSSHDTTQNDTNDTKNENVTDENVNSESVDNQKTDNPKVDNQFKYNPPSKYDPAYIVSVLELLGHREAGGVTEVRIFPNDRYLTIKGRREYVGATVSGYYDDYQKLASDIAPFDGKTNIYVTINPVIKDLLARAHNRLQYSAKTTTSDEDILCDLWFPIDIDPIRPADISSTDDELLLSIARRDEIVEFLSPWAQTIKGMSGSGGHSLIRLRGRPQNGWHRAGYPNDAETRPKKERLTKYLHDRFTDWELDAQGNPILDDKGAKIKRKDGVDVDNTVFNMSRIWKLYGTMAVKGDNVSDRPHRRSYLEIPDVIPEPVDLYALLDEIIPQQESTQEQEQRIDKGKASNEKRKETSSDDDYPFLDVPAYLNAWGGEWHIKEKSDRTWYQFRICPLHKDFDGDEWECGICQDADGKMGAKCMHDTEYTWQDFKEVLGNPKPYYKGKRRGRPRKDGTAKAAANVASQFLNTSFTEEELKELNKLHLTDVGNSQAFALLKGNAFRFDHKRKRWFFFDDLRWCVDTDGLAVQAIKEVAIARLAAAALIKDDSERKNAVKWALSSESRYRLSGALELAQSEPPLPASTEQFDIDPYLLGCANGVIHLKTGELKQGEQEDYITKSTGIAYDQDAECPRWIQFLDEVFLGNKALIGFIQKAIGYSLTGDISEQCLFIGFGSGWNGKSVFLTTLRGLLSDYARNTPFSTFTERYRETATNDLAALAGVRLVTSSEISEGRRLNEARVKAMTGGDPITARFLYGEYFDYIPAYKVWLAVNHKPVIKGTDEGIWRRIRLIPFEASFKENPDPYLGDDLKDELSGILRWAVEGCLKWKDERLGMVEKVKSATKEYQHESDIVAQFLAECTIEKENAARKDSQSAEGVPKASHRASCHREVKAGILYNTYKKWCEANGEDPISSTAFGQRMKEKGFEKEKKGCIYYKGIGLLIKLGACDAMINPRGTREEEQGTETT